MSDKVRLPLWERRFGRALLAWWIILLAAIACHIWQDWLGQDRALVWTCHTMGRRHCEPGQPWLQWRWPAGGDHDR